MCDDTCRETILDPSNDLLVCTISGRCFDRWLSAEEEEGSVGIIDKQTIFIFFSWFDCLIIMLICFQGNQLMDNNAVLEEAEEPSMGAGRLGKVTGYS